MRPILLTLLFCLVILAGPALAQDTPSSESAPALSSLELALWPEFDRPEVLVIYRGLFAPDTPLPVPVEIRIPARVGAPTAVAYVGEGGQRFNQEHTTRVEGDQLIVSFELDAQGFQLEYYDDLPVDPTGQRSYTYSYVADYPTAVLSLEFQVPPTAEGFALDPAADSVTQQGDGLTYHLVQVEALQAGDAQSWDLFYQKDNEDLTVSAFAQPETSAPAAPPPEANTDNSTVLIFLIAFVALVGVGAGAFWLGRRTLPDVEPSPPPPKRRQRRGSGRGPQPPISTTGQQTVFCYKCGAHLRQDSEFCHKCGAAVRNE